MDAAAALAVVAMMALTVLDVVLRLFRHPIPGAYEMIGLFGALFVSFSLARTALDKGHIAVDFFMQKLPPRVQLYIDAVSAATGGVLFFYAVRYSLRYAADLKTAGEVSMTLQIPTYPFVYGIAIGCGMLSFVLFIEAVDTLVSQRG